MSITTSYTDINSISQLKAGSDANSPENVRKVAQQFESLFVNMMIKSMRDANAVFAEGNPLNTPQTKFYQEMYDNQMAVHLSEGRGLGLSDALMRQLSPKAEAASTGADTGASGAAASGAGASAVDQSALLARRRLQVASDYSAWAERLDRAEASTASSQSNDWQPLRGIEAMRRSASTVAAVSGEAAQRTRFANSQEFVETMLPMAEKAAARLGVDPHYLVAQAALETGWGKSVIRQSDGSSSHNLFGIKAHGGWQGDSANVATTEYRNGVSTRERADFRSYSSWEQSFEDYVSFLETNGRYSKALSSTDNPDTFFRELQSAGYATDPQYARKVSQIARQLIGSSDSRVASADTTSDNGGRA